MRINPALKHFIKKGKPQADIGRGLLPSPIYGRKEVLKMTFNQTTENRDETAWDRLDRFIVQADRTDLIELCWQLAEIWDEHGLDDLLFLLGYREE